VSASAVVKRTVGFGNDFAFSAEVTFQTASGDVATVTEYGHTEWGAMARAKAKAAVTFTARKLACGFHADGFRDYTRNAASFRVGFA
jgi:hypothetical protein